MKDVYFEKRMNKKEKKVLISTFIIFPHVNVTLNHHPAFEDHVGDTIQFGTRSRALKKKQLREEISSMIEEAYELNFPLILSLSLLKETISVPMLMPIQWKWKSQ